MNDLDLLLYLALLINRTKAPAEIRKAIKWVIKRVPGSRRPALNLMLKANNPYRVIEKLLDDWDDIPTVTVARDQTTGRFYSLGANDGKVVQRATRRRAGTGDAGSPSGGTDADTPRAAGFVRRDPVTGRFARIS